MVGNHRQHAVWVSNLIVRACVWLLIVSSTPVAAQSVAPAVLDQATEATEIEATEIEATESETADAETTGDVPLLSSQAIEEDAPIEGVMAAETEANPNATPAPRPAIPTLLLPDDGEVTTAVNHPPVGIPMLSWERQLFAVKYVVQVSPSDSFAEAKSITTYATAYVPFLDMPDGPYYWRVQACGTGTSNCSEFSEVRTFVRDWSNDGEIVPTLISPPNNAVRSAFQPEDFSWTPVPGSDGYLFEIATDPNFSNIKYDEITIKAHHTPLMRLENSTYYWRVTPTEATLAQNNNIYSKPSATGTFVFSWDAAPRLLSPDADVDLKFVPRFQWTAVEAAKAYRLEVSTQPDMSNPKLVVDTDHTDYTPVKNLGNDQDYYWRVKAKDNRNVFSPYSEIRRFRMKWNFIVAPLPSNDANNPLTKQSYPFLSWTPIPGAERYQVQFDESDYKVPLLDAEFYNVNDASIYKIKDSAIFWNRTYNWRVRGIDAQGNYTPWSSDTFGDFPFKWEETTSPAPVYPPYYYAPDNANLPQHRDASIAWPVFVWDNAMDCFTMNCLTIPPDYYELTVAGDITFQDIRFNIKTKGNAVAPTTNHPFTDLVDGNRYYWRVRAFLENGAVDEQMGVDFVWITRIDRTLPLVAPSDVISLLHPYDAFESVGIPPVLGWQPVSGASLYRVQISDNPDFDAPGAIVDEAIAQFINYVPWQGRVDDMPFGAYWWRVQALNGAELPISDWSEVRHFNVSVDVIAGNRYDAVPPAYPSSILASRIVTDTDFDEDPITGITHTIVFTTYYDPAYTLLTTSPDAGMGNYSIDEFHMMTNRIDLRGFNTFSSQDWVLAFEAPTLSAGTTVLYGIYIDIDHAEGSGGTSDPRGKPIAVNSRYLPEFVLYVTRTSAGLSATTIAYYSWNADQSVWLPGPGNTTTLADIGGDAWYSANTNAVQLSIPYEKLGLNDVRSSGSLAVVVFSLNPNGGGMIDSLPKQSGSEIDRPLFVSDMLMPLYPFDTPLSNPMVHYDMPPFRWRMPYFDSIDGYQVQVARDAKFSDIVETWDIGEARIFSPFSWMPTIFQSTKAYADNESYYMRVRVRHERFYRLTDFDNGAWSPTIRIKLDSRQVQNMSISTGNPAGATPTFFWERVDGASGYTIQVDNDANFTSPEINQPIDGTSYTPDEPMPDGSYNWRVAMRRSKTIIGKWSPIQTFVKKTIAPTLISPINGVEISDQPTFKWTAVLAPVDEPRIAAAVYQLQVSNDPQFSKPLFFLTEATSFTPKVPDNLADGTWYWRVAVVDSKKRVGAYSEAQQFTRNYPKPQLLAPVQGASVSGNSIFQWTDIPAAATYEIQIDDDAAFNSPIKATTNGTTYVPTAQMKPGVYRWRVRMIDGDKIEGGYETGFVTIVDVNSTGKVFLPIIRN